MRMRASFAFFVLILLSFSTSAQAQSEYGKGEPTVYIGAAGLLAFDDRWGSGGDVNGGANLRMGVRVGAPVAFELQGDYIHLDEWRDDFNWTLTANFRVYPTQMEQLEGLVPDFLQPYAVAGVGVMGGDPAGDKYQLNGAFRLGVGGDFYVTEQVAISFGYEWITGTGFWRGTDTRNLTLGVQYNF